MALAACRPAVGEGDGVVDAGEVPEAGWVAVLDGHFHDASGTAIIVDATTLEVRDFTYDGGGLNTQFFLLADGEDFHDDYRLGENLVGQAFDGDTLTLAIPDHAPFEAWNLITLWCVPARVSFAEGVFQPADE